MIDEPAAPAEVMAAIRAPFAALDAVAIDPPVIQPLSLLLDLAGEAMRARLYIVQGEGDATTGWLAMEWVHGTDMSRYASSNRVLPEGVVVGICQRVAIALDLAHRAGIVHRDVKPSNVLFDPTTGTVKVTDFGSARVADTAATRSGVMMGTPA